VLIKSRPYNSSHRWSAVADLHTSPVITIDIQQKEEVSAVLSDNIVMGVYGAILNAWMDWRLWLFGPSASWGAQGAGLAWSGEAVEVGG
jgi:hypothetical protein